MGPRNGRKQDGQEDIPERDQDALLSRSVSFKSSGSEFEDDSSGSESSDSFYSAIDFNVFSENDYLDPDDGDDEGDTSSRPIGMTLVIVGCFEDLFEPTFSLMDPDAQAAEVQQAVASGMSPECTTIAQARTHMALAICMQLCPETTLYRHLFRKISEALAIALIEPRVRDTSKAAFLLRATPEFNIDHTGPVPEYYFEGRQIPPGFLNTDFLLTKHILKHVSYARWNNAPKPHDINTFSDEKRQWSRYAHPLIPDQRRTRHDAPSSAFATPVKYIGKRWKSSAAHTGQISHPNPLFQRTMIPKTFGATTLGQKTQETPGSGPNSGGAATTALTVVMARKTLTDASYNIPEAEKTFHMAEERLNRSQHLSADLRSQLRKEKAQAARDLSEARKELQEAEDICRQLRLPTETVKRGYRPTTPKSVNARKQSLQSSSGGRRAGASALRRSAATEPLNRKEIANDEDTHNVDSAQGHSISGTAITVGPATGKEAAGLLETTTTTPMGHNGGGALLGGPSAGASQTVSASPATVRGRRKKLERDPALIRKGRTVLWDDHDEELFLRAWANGAKYNYHYTLIADDIRDGIIPMHNRTLTHKTLRDKLRYKKATILRNDDILPAGFDHVLVDKKTQETVVRNGKNPYRKERDVDDQGNPINTEYTIQTLAAGFE